MEGMAVEPSWPSNYLNLARLFAGGDAAGMALFYGEIFRLFEPESRRSHEMARNMAEVIETRVRMTASDGDEGTISVRLAPGSAPISAQADGGATMPFVHAYEISFGPGLAMAVRDGLSLASLHAARQATVERWASNRDIWPDSEYFRWLVVLTAAGHLEAYDVWLFGPAYPEQAQAWLQAHRAEVDAMTAFVNEHPFEPTTAVRPDTAVPAPTGRQ